MNKLRSSVAVGALLLASASAHAADPAQVTEPAQVAETGAFAGVVEFGGLARYVAEYGEIDPDVYPDVYGLEDETTLGGVYGAAALWGDLGGVRLGLDGYVEAVSFDEVADDTSLTPRALGVFGAHVGLQLDTAYVGAFGALGRYPDRENEEWQTGVAGGIEALAQLDPALSLFGRAGYAFAPSEDYDPNAEDPVDVNHEGFIGLFVDLGMTYALSDDLAILAHVGAGYSDGFDFTEYDGTDHTKHPGGYLNWGAKIAYRLPTEFNLNLVASYDGYYAYTVKEQDETVEHTFKLGLSMPFGDGGTAASALNPLATPVAPFRAGYSSDTL